MSYVNILNPQELIEYVTIWPGTHIHVVDKSKMTFEKRLSFFRTLHEVYGWNFENDFDDISIYYIYNRRDDVNKAIVSGIFNTTFRQIVNSDVEIVSSWEQVNKSPHKLYIYTPKKLEYLISCITED